MSSQLSIKLILGLIFLLVPLACADVITNSPYYTQKYAQVNQPRGLIMDEMGDILVLSKPSSIISIYETDNSDGTIKVDQVTIVDNVDLALTHGLAYFNGYLYASSATTVYRWPYTPKQRRRINDQPQKVIQSIPSGGGLHITRSLIFDSESRLYVSIGSFENIDINSTRARVRRFTGINSLPDGGYDFESGEVFADGLRNSVGLDFDSNGVLWAVENSGDNLKRDDLGGDIHEKNPADELNRLETSNGKFYGYPYCFSSYELQDYAKGTQFVWPDFMDDQVHNDTWCQDENNNRKPIVSLPAHNAPLGIHFYKGDGCGGPGAFPCSDKGGAVISYHGSYDSTLKVGYRVAWLKFNNVTFQPIEGEIDILFEASRTTCNPCFRPVSAIFNKNGHLIVTADASNEIYKVTYGAPPKDIDNAGFRTKLDFLSLIFMVGFCLWQLFDE